MELCGARAELVARHARRIIDLDLERGARVGRPHAAMLDAERAAAGPRRNLRRIRFPAQDERDVPAVTLTVDEHALPLAGCDRATCAPRCDDLPHT